MSHIAKLAKSTALAAQTLIFFGFSIVAAIAHALNSQLFWPIIPWVLMAGGLIVGAFVFHGVGLRSLRSHRNGLVSLGCVQVFAFGLYVGVVCFGVAGVPRPGLDDDLLFGLLMMFSAAGACLFTRRGLTIFWFMSGQMALVLLYALMGDRLSSPTLFVLAGVGGLGAVFAVQLLNRNRRGVVDDEGVGGEFDVPPPDPSDAKTKLIATACHDLRQPAHAMTLFVHELSLLPATPEQGKILERLQFASDQMKSNLEIMTQIAVLDSGGPLPREEVISLDRFVADACAAVTHEAQTKGLKLHTIVAHCQVSCSRAVLQTVINNLLSNAIKYTDAGWVQVSSVVRGNSVDLIVQDTGRGIPEAECQRIYEEFFRGSNIEMSDPGVGLGLALVRRLVNRTGLGLRVSSAVNMGTRFVLTLPMAPMKAAETRNFAAESCLAGKSILLLEDDPVVAASMRSMITGWGASARTAKSVSEVMRIVSDELVIPDILIADYRLGSLSGIDAILAVRNQPGCRDLPAILVTGDLTVDADQLSSHGINLIFKPISPQALKTEILSVCKTQVV
ncbi:ATP-binding response regulator [Variovorax saccharolyticus]|uniref:ATP-binding response regulator n=1 Tax=Variovorax saccharolyticus TaxID=3053516 RepID=UPI002574930A|nr:hybrid sensor histidine kinase/response regulator [Variovorax sp. J31P216]MDM0030200.1 hybrid sensor histidine kinase/response regulator [Variovorax sp. J31P216]